MLELCDAILNLIARQEVEKEGGLRTLLSTCSRLRKVLPSEPAHFLDDILTHHGD